MHFCFQARSADRIDIIGQKRGWMGSLLGWQYNNNDISQSHMVLSSCTNTESLSGWFDSKRQQDQAHTLSIGTCRFVTVHFSDSSCSHLLMAICCACVTQKIPNCYTSDGFLSSKCTKNCFQPGFAPDATRELTALPRFLDGERLPYHWCLLGVTGASTDSTTTSSKAYLDTWLSLGPTVFRGKLCQIPWASSQNSTAHRIKIVHILQLTTAIGLWVN